MARYAIELGEIFEVLAVSIPQNLVRGLDE